MKKRRLARQRESFVIFLFLIILGYISSIFVAADAVSSNSTNCSVHRDDNGEKIPPSDRNQYAIDNAMELADDDDTYENMLDEIEKFINKNSEYDQCVGEQDVDDLVTKKFEEMESDQKKLLLIVYITTSISILISIVAIIISSVTHYKLKQIPKKTPEIDDQNNLQTICGKIRNDDLQMQTNDMGGSQTVLFHK